MRRVSEAAHAGAPRGGRADDAVLDDMSTDSAIEPPSGDDAVPDAATEANDPEPRSGATVRRLLGLPT